jgi:hypothetical protein
MAPSNIVASAASRSSLQKLAVREVKLYDTSSGEKLGLKTGIFSVIFSDSIHERYEMNSPYNIIDPKIAALEAASELKKKKCRLSIAVCGTEAATSEELAFIDAGIDIIINLSRSDPESRCYPLNGAYAVQAGTESPMIEKLTVILEKDRFEVKIAEKSIDTGG